jgi:hypothetical protein
MSDDVARDSAGRWLPGRSANPSGVPREVLRVKRIAQGHGPEMLDALVEIVRDKTAPHASRVAAAREVLDRGFGKPEQNVDIRLQQQKLELLLQGGVGSMSDDDLGALAARWDEISQRVIEHDPSEIP